MSFALIALVAFVLFLLVVGIGLFVMLVGSKDKGTGSKIGIIIAVMGFGMFILVCLGVPALFFLTARPEPLAREIVLPAVETHADEVIAEPARQPKPIQPREKQFGEIPVHLKENKENGNNKPVQKEPENKITTLKENE